MMSKGSHWRHLRKAFLPGTGLYASNSFQDWVITSLESFRQIAKGRERSQVVGGRGLQKLDGIGQVDILKNRLVHPYAGQHCKEH